MINKPIAIGIPINIKYITDINQANKRIIKNQQNTLTSKAERSERSEV
jgi:hypothetical protein